MVKLENNLPIADYLSNVFYFWSLDQKSSFSESEKIIIFWCFDVEVTFLGHPKIIRDQIIRNVKKFCGYSVILLGLWKCTYSFFETKWKKIILLILGKNCYGC